MRKIAILLIVLLIPAAFVLSFYLLLLTPVDNFFNSMRPEEYAVPKEIATYNSPNGEYSLVFEQMGDPQWPFGPTDVRLTLKNHDGTIIERVSAQLSADGANAGEGNIASISWNDDAVVVVLRASEMKDKKVSIAYKKS